jgi:hypothetical protein
VNVTLSLGIGPYWTVHVRGADARQRQRHAAVRARRHVAQVVQQQFSLL